MNDAGPWRLELEVPEHRMGHLLGAGDRLGTRNLAAEFIVATAAETTLEGSLEAVATRSTTAPDRGSVVEVFVSTDKTRLPNPRIGAEVRAKIDCGRRSLAYVLFGDVVEFVQRHFWL
jgi:hypothetical protein